jgi:hypothetical protein
MTVEKSAAAVASVNLRIVCNSAMPEDKMATSPETRAQIHQAVVPAQELAATTTEFCPFVGYSVVETRKPGYRRVN